MQALKRGAMVAASILAALVMLSAPAGAAGLGSGTGSGTGGSGSGSGSGGSGSGGSGSGGSGSSTGSIYADLYIVLRAADGAPILKKYVVPPTAETTSTTDYCVQPVSYQAIPGVAPSVNPVDGRTVWVIPLQGAWIASPPDPLPVAEISACDPQPQYAMFVSEVDLERLNLARTSEDVIATKLSDVQQKLEQGTSISLESTGRISIDGVPIDAAPENAAIYQSLMTTGTIPGLPASMAGPPAVIGPAPTSPGSNSQFDAWELAAMAIGAAASKSTPLSIDTVEYYNRIIGFPPVPGTSGTSSTSSTSPYVSPWGVHFVASTDPDTGAPMPDGQQFVDYSGFSYNRSETFKGSVTWLDVPTMTWKVSKITDVVPFTNLSSYPEIGDHTLYGVTAFAQLADDVRALCNYIPDNTFIPGFYMDVPGVDTTAAQLKAITDPAVNLGALPASVFGTSPFQVTASLLNPFGGNVIDNARLRITVHAPAPLAAGAVTATAVGGPNVPFAAVGGDLVGWWGPGGGFAVPPGYNVSSTFDVTVAGTAPTGIYDITLDLVPAADPSQILAEDAGTVTVLANQPTVLWGESVPKLTTQGEWMTVPLQVYSPEPGTGQLQLTVTGPGDDPTTPDVEALAAGDVTIYASTGTDMVAMPLTLNTQGQLVGTWDATLQTGFNPLDWYATVAVGAPVGNYALDVSLQGGNTLDSIVVAVAAPETHGQQPANAGDDITSVSSAAFTVSEPGTFTVTATSIPTPSLSAVGTLPSGVTFTDNGDGTASLAGVPAPGTAGDYPITVYAWFGGSTVSQTFVLTVLPAGSSSLPTSGYWLVASDGGVFAFGDATYAGSMASHPLNQPVVGMASTPDGKGYWLVASDGGVFAFGDATYAGSAASHPLNQPVVGMSATPDGKGYWLVASDGGVFAFGDATYAGSAGASAQQARVVGIEADRAMSGYTLVSSNGGIAAFGGAPSYGSMAGHPLNRPIVGMTSAV